MSFLELGGHQPIVIMLGFNLWKPLCDFIPAQNPSVRLQEAPKQTLCSLPISDLLYIVRYSIPKVDSARLCRIEDSKVFKKFQI